MSGTAYGAAPLHLRPHPGAVPEGITVDKRVCACPTVSRPRRMRTDDVRRLAVVGDRVRRAVLDATAEDLPDASFAGQQETFLNIRGVDAVLQAIREVVASLYNDRAIAYRVHHRLAHEAVALSAGVQRIVRSDLGSSGVMFTMDTESGFPDTVFITSSHGLGEAVVQGTHRCGYSALQPDRVGGATLGPPGW
jgi:hypothetical protein